MLDVTLGIQRNWMRKNEMLTGYSSDTVSAHAKLPKKHLSIKLYVIICKDN